MKTRQTLILIVLLTLSSSVVTSFAVVPSKIDGLQNNI